MPTVPRRSSIIPSTRRCRRRSRGRRSTWPWRSSDSCAPRQTAKGPGISSWSTRPRRARHWTSWMPRTASAPSSTDGSSRSSPLRHAARAAASASFSVPDSGSSPESSPRSSAPNCSPISPPSSERSTRCSAASANERRRRTPCSRIPARPSSWLPLPSATPFARPPTSWIALGRTACRSRGWSSTVFRRFAPPNSASKRRRPGCSGYRLRIPVSRHCCVCTRIDCAMANARRGSRGASPLRTPEFP